MPDSFGKQRRQKGLRGVTRRLPDSATTPAAASHDMTASTHGIHIPTRAIPGATPDATQPGPSLDSVEVLCEPAQLDEIAADWNRLACRFPSPLLRHEWFAACASCLCKPGALAVVVVRSGGKVSAIAPLCYRREKLLRTLHLLGSELYEPGGFLYEDENSLRRLASAVARLGRPVVLSRMPAGCPEIAALVAAAGENLGWLSLRPSDETPWLPIDGDWPRFEASLSARRRSDLRRALRKANEFGSVSFDIAPVPAPAAEAALDAFFRVEAAGWKGRAGTALRHDPALRQFFSRYAAAAARLGLLHLGFLRIGGEPASALLGICCANRFWLLKVGYDERWARCSPGFLLIHHSIRYAFEHGLEAYEFLGTAEPWIRVWTASARSHVAGRLYSLNWRAAAHAAAGFLQMLGAALID